MANLRFSPITDLLTGEDPPVDWLIPGFVPRGSVIALAGMPGVGKSFVSYTFSLGLATGTPVLDFQMQPHRVLYFDQENSRPDYIQYLRWSWIGLDRPSLELIGQNFHHAHLTLGTKDWASTMRQYVAEAQPALIVIDTASPACNIQDENDNAEATQVISAIKSMVAACTPAPAVLVLKHAKVKAESGGYTLRGAKAWEGMVDSIIFHVRSEGKARDNGLRTTRLEPSKSRAFGLREIVHIDPQYVEADTGLKLIRTY